MIKMTTTITWTDENKGQESRSGCTSTVYRPAYGIKLGVMEYMEQLIRYPENWQTREFPNFKRYSYNPLDAVRPKINYLTYLQIAEKMKELVPIFLENQILSDFSSLEISDYQFLLSLGAVRNWKSGCVICLTDKMMGTTCGCGHTEIAIFRPCGHSVCVEPCFRQLMDRNNIVMDQHQKIKVGGQTMSIVGKLDVRQAKNFTCPICRGEVKKTFRAEDVHTPVTIYETVAFKQLIEQILDDPEIKFLLNILLEKF